jgi:integrase
MALIKTLTSLFTKQKTLIEVIEENEKKLRIEEQHDEATITKHEYHFNNIKSFLSEIGETNIKAKNVRPKLMEQLRCWLYQNLKCKHDHANRHIRMCKNALDHGVAMDYIEYNSLTGIKSKRSTAKEVISLDLFEVKKFIAYLCFSDTVQVCKDLFLFQCFTGLSYMDLWTFEIKQDKGISWVTCESGRGKTKKIYWSELTEIARAILNKYEGNFPIVGNQVYNKTVRKICRRVGITKHITTHIGRKTFATIKDEQGFSLETIADMLGNTPKTTYKHYLNKSKKRVENEIKRLDLPGDFDALNLAS